MQYFTLEIQQPTFDEGEGRFKESLEGAWPGASYALTRKKKKKKKTSYQNVMLGNLRIQAFRTHVFSKKIQISCHENRAKKNKFQTFGMNNSRDNPEKHFISLPLLPSELAAEGGMVEADLPINKEADSYTEYEDNFVVPQVCSADIGSEVDGGYSSHSTCSSCPMDNQSAEQMEYVQQRDQQPTDSDWCEYDSCCIPGNSEVDDILYHFDQFFRGQVDQAIGEFQERMGSILNEQQIHIRQIIAKALRSHHSQVKGQEQVAERDPSDICQPPFKISRISSEVWEAISPYLPASMTNQSSSSDANQMDSRGDKSSTKDSCVEDASSSTTIKPSSEGDMKHKLIIQLLTLTNNVSAMLLKPEYRS